MEQRSWLISAFLLAQLCPWVMRQIHYYPQLDSTSRVAKDLLQQGAAAGTVVLAAQQSAGRGQYGRTFASPPGGLYFSLILYPEIQAQEAAMVTLAAGLGCRDALGAQCGLSPQIKWPNDLYCAGRKIAGILTEYCLPAMGRREAAVVIGAGLNVNSSSGDFPEELRPLLGTVRDLTGAAIHDMETLLEACAACIERRVAQLLRDRSTLLAEWQKADYLLGRRIRHLLNEQVLATGIGRGIDYSGRYLLEQDDGSTGAVLAGQLKALEG